MPRVLGTLFLLLLVALVPFRAVAAVTVGYCATYSESAVAAHGDHGHGTSTDAHHDSDDPPAAPGTPSCGSCVEHCSGAAFAPLAEQMLGAPAIAQDRIHFAGHTAPAHVPDQLDRPPLAELR